MKRYLLILFILFGNIALLRAQDAGDPRVEKVQSLKIAFITQKLQLSPEEAQHFWPVYDQYQKEVQDLQLENRNSPVIEIEEKLLDIRKRYLGTFERMLGADKTNRLFTAERDFRTLLIRRLQNRNQQRFGPMRR